MNHYFRLIAILMVALGPQNQLRAGAKEEVKTTACVTHLTSSLNWVQLTEPVLKVLVPQGQPVLAKVSSRPTLFLRMREWNHATAEEKKLTADGLGDLLTDFEPSLLTEARNVLTGKINDIFVEMGRLKAELEQKSSELSELETKQKELEANGVKNYSWIIRWVYAATERAENEQLWQGTVAVNLRKTEINHLKIKRAWCEQALRQLIFTKNVLLEFEHRHASALLEHPIFVDHTFRLNASAEQQTSLMGYLYLIDLLMHERDFADEGSIRAEAVIPLLTKNYPARMPIHAFLSPHFFVPLSLDALKMLVKDLSRDAIDAAETATFKANLERVKTRLLSTSRDHRATLEAYFLKIFRRLSKSSLKVVLEQVDRLIALQDTVRGEAGRDGRTEDYRKAKQTIEQAEELRRHVKFLLERNAITFPKFNRSSEQLSQDESNWFRLFETLSLFIE